MTAVTVRTVAEEVSARVIDQLVRIRVIATLEILAEGNVGLFAAGDVEYFKSLFDWVDDDTPGSGGRRISPPRLPVGSAARLVRRQAPATLPRRLQRRVLGASRAEGSALRAPLSGAGHLGTGQDGDRDGQLEDVGERA